MAGNSAHGREYFRMEDAPAEPAPDAPAPGGFAPLPLPDLPGIFAPGETLEKIAGGFVFTEGPVYDAAVDVLYFSDSPADALFCYRFQTGQVEVVRQPSHYSNGNALDADGQLITCEHQTRRVTRAAPFEAEGEMLADTYEGKRLNSPNDVVVKSDGAIYFTDPPFGLANQTDNKELDFCGVYRIGNEGNLTLLTADLPRPNGLAFSPDESVLYVDDSQEKVLYAFPVLPDGRLGERRVWADLKRPESRVKGGPDGTRWVTCSARVRAVSGYSLGGGFDLGFGKRPNLCPTCAGAMRTAEPCI